jgi:hypothetical protein
MSILLAIENSLSGERARGRPSKRRNSWEQRQARSAEGVEGAGRNGMPIRLPARVPTGRCGFPAFAIGHHFRIRRQHVVEPATSRQRTVRGRCFCFAQDLIEDERRCRSRLASRAQVRLSISGHQSARRRQRDRTERDRPHVPPALSFLMRVI